MSGPSSGSRANSSSRSSAGPIQVVVNGETLEIPGALNVIALLSHLKLPANRVAIERNLNILPRDAWEQTEVSSGDRFEIVHLVGGG